MAAPSRSPLAGMTDYSGLPLADLIEQLSIWRNDATRAAEALQLYLDRARTEAPEFPGSSDVAGFVRTMQNELSRFSSNFDRLTRELPLAVLPAHLALVEQMVQKSDMCDRLCVGFKNRHIETHVSHDTLRRLFDRIYQDSREFFIDIQDLSNLATALQTFIGVQPLPPTRDAPTLPVEALPALTLKPNVFGLGFNLNYVLGWVRRLRRRS